MLFRTIAIGLGGIISSACSPSLLGGDNATPVPLEAGQYQVSHTSELPADTSIKMPIAIAKGGRKMCLDGTDDAAKLDKLVHDYLAKGVSCEQDDFKRDGNSITGTQSCRTSSLIGRMRSEFRYSGDLMRDSVRIKGNIFIDIPNDPEAGPVPDAMIVYRDKVRDLDIVIEAKRIGDC